MALEATKLRGIPTDTTAEVYRVHCEALRGLSAEDRGHLMVDFIDFTDGVSAAGVRLRHPDYSDEQIRMAVIRIRLGDHLFKQVYPGVEVAP